MVKTANRNLLNSTRDLPDHSLLPISLTDQASREEDGCVDNRSRRMSLVIIHFNRRENLILSLLPLSPWPSQLNKLITYWWRKHFLHLYIFNYQLNVMSLLDLLHI